MNNRLNKLFWFSDVKSLDKEKDKYFIVHQVLCFGSLEDIQYLFKLYPKSVIKKCFLKPKKGIYDPRVVALIKEMLNIKYLDFRKYVKNVSKTLHEYS